MFGTEDPQTAVSIIIEEVRKNGDEALKDYSVKISGTTLKSVEVSRGDMEKACKAIPAELYSAIETAAERVRTFHRKQFDAYMSGVKQMAPGTVARILNRVGLYVPGGTASYPSSVIDDGHSCQVGGSQREVIVCLHRERMGESRI
jgi:histidinol dehydrogenase